MAGEIRRISINEIINYYEKPRHAIAMNEKDTLKKLFEAVGNYKLQDKNTQFLSNNNAQFLSSDCLVLSI